jgi:hypothetical protein
MWRDVLGIFEVFFIYKECWGNQPPYQTMRGGVRGFVFTCDNVAWASRSRGCMAVGESPTRLYGRGRVAHVVVCRGRVAHVVVCRGRVAHVVVCRGRVAHAPLVLIFSVAQQRDGRCVCF